MMLLLLQLLSLPLRVPSSPFRSLSLPFVLLLLSLSIPFSPLSFRTVHYPLTVAVAVPCLLACRRRSFFACRCRSLPVSFLLLAVPVLCLLACLLVGTVDRSFLVTCPPPIVPAETIRPTYPTAPVVTVTCCPLTVCMTCFF